jgi:hypothetical protein
MLAARLTGQAELRLRLTTPSMVVDDNALCWDVPVSGLSSVLGTVLDCPDVDVVVVALDEPRTHLDHHRYLDLEREAAQACWGARVVACVPGVGVTHRLPTFSSATACADALALVPGGRGRASGDELAPDPGLQMVLQPPVGIARLGHRAR